MKLGNSTKILINLMLILVIIFLIKSLISLPKNAYAKKNVEYKVVEARVYVHQVQSQIDKYVNEGWKLHSYASGLGYLIFER